MSVETFAIIFTVVCIFLAGRNSIHTWWTGIVACILYGAVFYDAKLYADMLLQVFFIGTSVNGYLKWKGGNNVEIPISTTHRTEFVSYIGLAIVVAIGYALLLKTCTDAAAPMMDSLVLTLSVVAQLLLMSRKLENWPVWIAVNTISVPLYIERGLYQSAVMYSVFFLHAFYAWYSWNRTLNEQTKTV